MPDTRPGVPPEACGACRSARSRRRFRIPIRAIRCSSACWRDGRARNRCAWPGTAGAGIDRGVLRDPAAGAAVDAAAQGKAGRGTASPIRTKACCRPSGRAAGWSVRTSRPFRAPTCSRDREIRRPRCCCFSRADPTRSSRGKVSDAGEPVCPVSFVDQVSPEGHDVQGRTGALSTSRFPLPQPVTDESNPPNRYPRSGSGTRRSGRLRMPMPQYPTVAPGCRSRKSAISSTRPLGHLHTADRAALIVGLVVDVLPVFRPDRIVEASPRRARSTLRREIEQHQLALIERHGDEIPAVRRPSRAEESLRTGHRRHSPGCQIDHLNGLRGRILGHVLRRSSENDRLAIRRPVRVGLAASLFGNESAAGRPRWRWSRSSRSCRVPCP